MVKDFSHEEKIVYFILDNTSTNDTALRCLEVAMQGMHAIGSIKGSVFSSSDRWLCCFGQIVNLLVKALLFGMAVNQNVGAGREEESNMICRKQKKILFLRQFGLLGRVHNIIIWIRRSPQRIQMFLALQTADCEETTDFLLDSFVEDLEIDRMIFNNFSEGKHVALKVIADIQIR